GARSRSRERADVAEWLIAHYVATGSEPSIQPHRVDPGWGSGAGEAATGAVCHQPAIVNRVECIKICANEGKEFRSPTAAPPCVLDAANRSLPATSRAVLASAPLHHHWLAATRSGHALGAWQIGKVHLHPTIKF